MAVKTLQDVVNELKIVNKSTVDTTAAVNKLAGATDRFAKMLDQQSDRERLQKAEDDAETKVKRTKKSTPGGVAEAFQSGLNAGVGFNIVALLKPARLVSLIFGGALAGLGVAGGLRGWEADFVKHYFKRFFGFLGLTENGRLPPADQPRVPLLARIMNAFGRLPGRILRMLGLAPSGGLPPAAGGAREPLLTRIISAFSRLENRVLGFFGVNVDGTIGRDAAGRFTPRVGRVTVVSRITDAISNLLRPLSYIAEGINKYIAGPAARILGFIGGASGAASLGRVVAGVATLAGRILWPLGILVSLFDGVTTFMNSDESNIALRFIDGIGAFIGDFIGAPLDLLKDLSAGVFRALGFDAVADFLNTWSFEDNIKSLISYIARVPGRLFDHIGEKMDDFNIVDMLGNVGARVAMAIDTFKIGFQRVANFIANIPDRLLRLIAGILDFELPRLTIPILGTDIVLFPGGRPFGSLGDAGTRADARIQARDTELAESVAALEVSRQNIANVLSQRLAAQTAERVNLAREERSFGNTVNIVAPTTNSDSTVNQTSITTSPSPFDNYVPR
jgi:hypothetical protein